MIDLLFDGQMSAISLSKTDPYGRGSSYDNFQNNQNSDFQNSRSVILSGSYQILSSEFPSSGCFEDYQTQDWCRKDRSKEWCCNPDCNHLKYSK
jgi:hypothetical protein